MVWLRAIGGHTASNIFAIEWDVQLHLRCHCSMVSSLKLRIKSDNRFGSFFLVGFACVIWIWKWWRALRRPQTAFREMQRNFRRYWNKISISDSSFYRGKVFRVNLLENGKIKFAKSFCTKRKGKKRLKECSKRKKQILWTVKSRKCNEKKKQSRMKWFLWKVEANCERFELLNLCTGGAESDEILYDLIARYIFIVPVYYLSEWSENFAAKKQQQPHRENEVEPCFISIMVTNGVHANNLSRKAWIIWKRVACSKQKIDNNE